MRVLRCCGSTVRPRTFGCVAMGSAVLFIVRSRLQVVLSGFSIRLFFVQVKTLCRYGCMYILTLVYMCQVIVLFRISYY